MNTDVNLSIYFIDYISDNFPDLTLENFYIHWHPAVDEYCVYINDKWFDYVPEEYIFKAGYEHYHHWKEREIERHHDEYMRDYHYTIMNLRHEIELTKKVLSDLINNRSYTHEYRIMTLETLLLSYTKENKENEEFINFINELILEEYQKYEKLQKFYKKTN